MAGMAADIFCDATGKKWTATITNRHGVVWQKSGMSSQHNAETAMEAAWQRLNAIQQEAAE